MMEIKLIVLYLTERENFVFIINADVLIQMLKYKNNIDKPTPKNVHVDVNY